MLTAINPWLLTAIAFGGGLVIGTLLVWYLSHRNREGGENARRLRRELDGYRQLVDDHFGETAELVNTLDQSYRAVYNHLQRGAERLVGREAVRATLHDGDESAAQLASPADTPPIETPAEAGPDETDERPSDDESTHRN